MDYQKDYQNAVEIGSSELDPRCQRLVDCIEGGKQDAAAIFSNLEKYSPKDYIINTGQLGFGIQENKILVSAGENEWRLHRNAVQQMVIKTGVLTTGVAHKMLDNGAWGEQLLQHNLEQIFENTDRERVLLRTVPTEQGQEIRGFLSDSYRRMSAGPIMQTFAERAVEFGAVPIRIDDPNRNYRTSYYHDLRVGLSLFLPFVFRPVADEFIILGMTVQNSDFGNAALSVSFISMRIFCRNLMITKNELRKVHLGARLPDDLAFSQETYNLDTKTMASAMGDMVNILFSPDRVNEYTGKITAAASQRIDVDKLMTSLRTGGQLQKGEANRVKEIYNSADIELLPSGQNVWRAAQAISLFANELDDESPERAVDMRETAGLVMDKYAVN